MVVKHEEGSRSTTPDSVAWNQYETPGSKPNSKQNQLLNVRYKLEACFYIALKILIWPLAYPISGFFNRSQENVQTSPHPVAQSTWLECLKDCSNSTWNPSFGNRQQITNQQLPHLLFTSTSAHAQQAKASPSAGCLPTALPVILFMSSFSSSQIPARQYFNILELQVKYTRGRKPIPTAPSFQSSGLYCVVTSPVHPTVNCQTPVLCTVWCSWQAFITSTLFRCPCLQSFDPSLLFITVQENFHNRFLTAAKLRKVFYWTVQP